MSQKEIDLVAQREQAIHLLRAGQSQRAVGKALKRHENWVGKWWRRYQAEGWSGLKGRSHAPKHHGRKLSSELRQAICQARSELEAEAARGEGLKYIGPIAVKTRLKDKKVQPLPSRASIERVLKEAGMTRKKKAAKTEGKVKYPHLKPGQPHQLCQVDIVPHYLSGGERVPCFNGIDVVSRYPTGLAFAQRRSQDAAQFLLHLWQEIGLPRYTQVDNEGCFSGGASHRYVLGKVVRLALNVDTELVFSPFYHPQSNGTVERFHQDYDRHVWQETYLRHQQDVRNRSRTFFSLYRHSRHHSQLMGQSPDECHHQQPPVKLPADFALPTTKLPLREGQIHFIRRIEAKGTVKVLNAHWDVPNFDPKKGVWVTITFKQSGATLRIYDAAPDAPQRQCLVTYPFPLNEPVLPHPSRDKTHPLFKPDQLAQPNSDIALHSALKLLPLPPWQPETLGGRLLLTLISSPARLANRIAHTIY